MNNELEHNNSDNNEISIIDIIAVLFRRRWLILIIAIVCMILGGVLAIARYKVKYTASSSILLQQPRNVTVMKGSYVIPKKSIVPGTYKVVLGSGQLLSNVVMADYSYSLNGKVINNNLINYYNIKTQSDKNNVYAVSNIVKDSIKTSYNKKTFVLTISYTTTSPQLSAAIVNNIVKQLNLYYQKNFNSSARENLGFLKNSLDSAQKELNQSRIKLGRFVKKNKQLSNIDENSKSSSTTSFYESKLELNKLEDDAKVKKELFSNISEKYQMMKLELLAQASTITVLEQANSLIKPSPCSYKKYAAIGFILGLIVGIGYVIMINCITIFNLERTQIEEVSSGVKSDLNKLLRLIGFRRKK